MTKQPKEEDKIYVNHISDEDFYPGYITYSFDSVIKRQPYF